MLINGHVLTSFVEEFIDMLHRAYRGGGECSQGTLFVKNSYTSQRQWDLLLSATNQANTSKLYA